MVSRNAWCEVNLTQFRRNLEALKPPGGAKVLLAVKSNAYGHGLVRMAQEAVNAGVFMLGLGTINEAVQLREAGITAPILMLTPMLDDEIAWCVNNDVQILAWRADQFESARRATRKTGKIPKIHVEVDFGMARSGVDEKEFVELIDGLDDEARSYIVGLCAHYVFAAVAPTMDILQEPVDMFLRCAEHLATYGVRPLRHVSNSAGTLRFPGGHLDMVRLGISAYGIASTKLFDVSSVVSPLITWKARVTNVNSLEVGEGVSYGWEYIAETPHQIATIGVGYADGFHRHPSYVNTVLVGGVETPVLGRINTDQCVFRVPDGMQVSVGDEVVLLGKQGDAEITIPQLAERWETNGYDVVIGIRNRVTRVYV